MSAIPDAALQAALTAFCGPQAPQYHLDMCPPGEVEGLTTAIAAALPHLSQSDMALGWQDRAYADGRASSPFSAEQIDAIWNALNDFGANPALHKMQIARLKREWLPLYVALMPLMVWEGARPDGP